MKKVQQNSRKPPDSWIYELDLKGFGTTELQGLRQVKNIPLCCRPWFRGWAWFSQSMFTQRLSSLTWRPHPIIWFVVASIFLRGISPAHRLALNIRSRGLTDSSTHIPLIITLVYKFLHWCYTSGFPLELWGPPCFNIHQNEMQIRSFIFNKTHPFFPRSSACCLFLVLGIDPSSSCMLNVCCTTEIHPQPLGILTDKYSCTNTTIVKIEQSLYPQIPSCSILVHCHL